MPVESARGYRPSGIVAGGGSAPPLTLAWSTLPDVPAESRPMDLSLSPFCRAPMPWGQKHRVGYTICGLLPALLRVLCRREATCASSLLWSHSSVYM